MTILRKQNRHNADIKDDEDMSDYVATWWRASVGSFHPVITWSPTHPVQPPTAHDTTHKSKILETVGKNLVQNSWDQKVSNKIYLQNFEYFFQAFVIFGVNVSGFSLGFLG
jgi:hypothetical protein